MQKITISAIKILLLIIPLLSSTTSNLFSQEVCFNYMGSWSSWAPCPGKITKYIDDSGLVLRTQGGLEFFKFHINNYRKPTKEEIKQHFKNNKSFIYYGTVEYYVSDHYPTAKDFSKASAFVVPDPRLDITPVVLRHAKCEIRILPYQKQPEVYYIMFDDIAIEISIKGLSWK